MKTTHAIIAGALLATAVMLAGGASAQTVVNGQASFQQIGNVRTITNTPGTIIQWPGFSIGAGEVTRFVQQNAASAVLNRITGQEPSLILGALQSNGRVFLVNPNGVLFGAGSRVDVNGLVASSLTISNSDFLAGKMNFSAGAVAGHVVNQGSISTPGGGQVILIAPQVGNSGLIHSPGGEVVLAAGRSVKLADSQNPALHVVVSAPQDQAVNLGQIVAQSGRIGIFGNLVNQRGLVSADQAAMGANGQIVLKASGDLLLEAGSLTSASGAGDSTGGTIHLLGERVGLTGNARVDASGQAGGGTVLIGGDYRGQNPAIANAKQVYVSGGATIRADALASGNGGKVIAWSDGTTRVYGSISARGGAQSGNGGFVETSGHTLDMRGRVDTRAPNGRTGTLLLDPTNLYIANDQASAASAGMTGSDTSAETFVASGPVSDSLLTVATLEAALANNMVTVTTDNASGTGAGMIHVVNPVTWASDTGLTLHANAGIEINAALTGGRGSRLELYTASGNINQTAPLSVVALSARADNGSVNLTHRDNQVERLAGFANGAGGFNYRGNGTPLVIGMAGPEDGITSLGSGPINVAVTGDLTLQSPVSSQAGDIVLAAGNFDNQSTVDSVSGRVTVQGAVLRPSLADCIANTALAGCTAVLPILAACQADPAIPGCSAVLPPPTLDACIAAPATSGCAAVLPTLTQCTIAPSTAGCSVVLPTLASCIASPTLAGCAAVLPTLAQCVASPALAGCAAVLPTLSQCIASPALAGCAAVLPTLSQCTITPLTAGCSVVLPSLNACVASPALAGCAAVLPALSQCIASPALAGCTTVLPTLAQCVASPALAGCAAVLPRLSQCVASPTLAGCSVVLPTLAQCTASPTLQGCSAVLPPASICVSNPASPGCAVVVPPVQIGANSPVDQALNATINIINTSGNGTALLTQLFTQPNDARGTADASIKKTFCN
ncbi:two-partner secretion domain-containing protein [Polaromonas naphthalenivorans]|uniref:Filamentous hemagglutinin family outer membrane protein n=1 Tax=Polaromonas naphthalenivorans (strain CJ2) TaxID=365044 RepID=A1VUH8_POLNA|nr:filamentous hemagglutinin N-terminal domain-containing protein [Polaromonas naphthalenivorans]ABM39306.1 filamentous hemagglutinin family outer membrane protein [Polaromonas naphthalenivorans CJ2]